MIIVTTVTNFQLNKIPDFRVYCVHPPYTHETLTLLDC